MSKPNYTLQDIQLSVEDNEFNKGLKLFKDGKVGAIKNTLTSFEAIVFGTEKYTVVVESNNFEQGDCNCYLGQKDYLCKHMLALAIAVVHKYRPQATTVIDHPLNQAVCSGKIGEINGQELSDIESEIKAGLVYIKSWSGTSKKWFEYQDGISKGSRIILLALSKLPICEKSVTVCITLLKKLEKKLLGPVDDSDGTVGNLVEETIQLLCLFVDLSKDMGPYVAKSLPKGEVYNWEESFFAFHEELRVHQKQ